MLCPEGDVSVAPYIITISIIVGMALIIGISTRISRNKKMRQREKSLPFVSDTINADARYTIRLSDGHGFENTQIIGTDDQSNEFSIFGWYGMLVIKLSDGKKVFLRRSAIRYIKEV